MWTGTYSQVETNITAAQVWAVWTDINNWHTWQSDIEYAKLNGEFKVGSSFVLKPKSGPKVNIELFEVIENQQFIDMTKFPGARMYGSHEFKRHGADLEIITTMSIEGPLSWVWRKLVAEGIAKSLKLQTENLINKVRNG